MGKSKIWINGKLVKTYFGGYLPINIDITDYIKWDTDNIIAVLADNSDDPNYPPGKEQKVLDFAYFGGIYRDCWLITHNPVYITNSNHENEIAGGGVLVAYPKVSESKAEIFLKTHLKNEEKKPFNGSIIYELINPITNKTIQEEKKVSISSTSSNSFTSTLHIKNPELWSPDHPFLYHLNIKITDRKGKVIDGYTKRIGIRSIEFKGLEGLWINGKPFSEPLLGANRHQDFALVGNALSNNIHWRDAKKLRDAGLRIIRNAHYPQDPAFMDACDELGLFVIVNTPGWQFWNDDPNFEKLVYQDIRNMVRRDRNRASLFLWEPILNETHYPDYFAKRTKEIVYEEFPYPNSYAACDRRAKGSKYYDVQFEHPPKKPNTTLTGDPVDPTKTYFTREWGDNVDDWNAHNSSSRVHRDWGEQPMLIQATHYATPSYSFTSLDRFHKSTKQYTGGTLWHAFDHQRGYHPDKFYGGIMDDYRQPKYSYYMFMSQRNPNLKNLRSDTGPMVYIANEMTPFSSEDVTVYSNCDKVTLKEKHG